MPPEPVEDSVRRFIARHRLVSPGERLLVGVSGGADSVCLLHVLSRLRAELEIDLHVAHLDHRLRGEESAADAEYVRELARSLNIPATIESRDVMAYRAERRLSLEEAAREVRYSFLAEAAESSGASRAAVGHTSDDDVETILLHIIRGSGTRGLRGLQPSSRLRYSGRSLTVIRPLLRVSCRETAAYCERHGLAPRLDVSNLSLSPLRNRIRHELLPLLRGYNPRVSEALLRTALIASDDLDYISESVTRLWDRLAAEKEDTIILDRKLVNELPRTLKRHALLTAIEKLLGTVRDFEMRHVEDMLAALDKPAGKRLDLARGIVFAVEYDRYIISRETATLVPFPELQGESRLNIPGETRLPGWVVSAELVPPPEVKREGDIFTACLDADIAGARLSVSPRRPGDRFQPLGMSEQKKLGEFMIDARLPRVWRDRVPVVRSPEQVLWVVGWRIDERARVTSSTISALRLRFKRA